MPSTAARRAPQQALLDQAVALHRTGRLGEAFALYEQILVADPAHADALNLSGLVRLSQGDAGAAVDFIARAVRIDPASAMFRLNLGTAQAACGDNDKAIAGFERALKLKPDLAAAWAALGLARAARGEERKAAYALRRAVAIAPDMVEAWNNLALVLARLGEADAARDAAEKAIAIRPDFAVAHNTAGALARERGDGERSIAHLTRAVELAPGHFEAHNNLGVSLDEAGRYDDAVAAFERAIKLSASHAETWRALAKPLAALGQMDRARAACERALELAPGNARTVWEKALVDLADGRFAGGWQGYLARSTVDRDRHPVPAAPLPENLSGRTIVVEGEQGLGEELFFLRFAAPLKARGARIVARVEPRLVAMAGRIPFIDEAQPRDTGNRPGKAPAGKGADDLCLAGDLPWISRAGDGVLAPAPVAARDELRASSRTRLAAAGPGPYLALTWRAGIAGRNTLFKEAPIGVVARAAKGCGATLIALQRNPAAGEIEELAKSVGRPVADFTDLNDDLEAMLALMFELDRYVAVSNTNVHLAATARAAGARVRAHVLVPCPAEFRWLAQGDQSPWFPDFPVYREDAHAGWSAAGDALAADIAGI